MLSPILALFVLAGLSACSDRPTSLPQALPARSQAAKAIRFVDVAANVGLNFHHNRGLSSKKHFPETMGSGGGFIDFDGDGDLDIYAVNGNWIAPPPDSLVPANALFQQRSTGSFIDVAAAARVDHQGIGMGSVAGDVDNDGHLDLYLSNYGTNVLYRNQGDGTFADITYQAGVGDPRWGTSCAFADYDRDGDLDLFVANYVDYQPENQPKSTTPYLRSHDQETDKNLTGYPHPDNFPGSADVLYRNQGNGIFADITRQAGVYSTEGKGLGVIFADADNDGWPDLYVANDAVRNFHYFNNGDGTFTESASQSGTAYGQDGQMEAGMGVDSGDWDNDGDLDLTVTNFQGEPNGLYLNSGKRFFKTAAFASGAGLATLPFLGFGTNFLDVDNDGRLDLFVGNGHVLDNVERFDQSTTYAQRNLLFHNRGPTHSPPLVEISLQAGSGFQLEQISRGSAAGDYDNDGDLDLLVFNGGQYLALLRNDGDYRRNWLSIGLVGTKSNRWGIGARLVVRTDSLVQSREIKSGNSYLSHSDLRAHFGLNHWPQADLEIHWPSGLIEIYPALKANQFLRLTEGSGRAH